MLFIDLHPPFRREGIGHSQGTDSEGSHVAQSGDDAELCSMESSSDNQAALGQEVRSVESEEEPVSPETEHALGEAAAAATIQNSNN